MILDVKARGKFLLIALIIGFKSLCFFSLYKVGQFLFCWLSGIGRILHIFQSLWLEFHHLCHMVWSLWLFLFGGWSGFSEQLAHLKTNLKVFCSWVYQRFHFFFHSGISSHLCLCWLVSLFWTFWKLAGHMAVWQKDHHFHLNFHFHLTNIQTIWIFFQRFQVRH